MKQLFTLFILFNLSNFAIGQTAINPELLKSIRSSLSYLETIHEGHENHVHFLPIGTTIDNITTQNGKANIYFTFPYKFLKNLTDEQFDEIMELSTPYFNVLNSSEYYFYAKNLEGKYTPFEDYLPRFDIPEEYNTTARNVGDVDKNREKTKKLDAVVAYPLPKQKKGALEGKTIWLSPGHGWRYFRDDWRTQRTTTFGVVEDFGTIESVNYYLLKYLENAGANVWMVRERDMNTNEVIVDDEDKGFTTEGNWTESSATGYNSNYQYIYTQAEETGRASFSPEIPESGYYWVSVYFRDGNNRSEDTRYYIEHAGGESIVSINQSVHGLSWIYLGQFYFEKGGVAKVSLSNKSSDVGKAVIADAVRFGGGMGSIKENGKLSGKPRFEEAATYYTQFQGFQSRDGDVTVRPEYAEWELAKGTKEEQENAIYVAWHTNAGGGNGTGTESFIYNRGATEGSYDLCRSIHNELVTDVRANFNPKWKDRGVKKANFGELRRLRTMPGALIEIGFHDNKEDADALLTPEFRDISAKAVYHGIVEYYAKKDNKEAVFLPEKPTHLIVRNIGNNRIKVLWNAPAATSHNGDEATGYKVYISKHGKAFTEGLKAFGTSYVFDNLDPNTTYYFKVTATNAGGESFPTQVLAARTYKKGQTKSEVLMVEGFDRLDKYAAIKQNDGKYLGTTTRLFIDRMNRYDYAVEHAEALSTVGVSFDAASNEAVRDLKIGLDKYQAVTWILGEESSKDFSLDVNERTVIRKYLQQGGNLLISGSEVAYEIARNGGTDPWFYNTFLKAQYAGDDAKTYTFNGSNGLFLNDLKGDFDNSENGFYDVDYPDLLRPIGGAKAILSYNGGLGGTAGIAYDGKDFKVVNYGFPLETVTNEAIRNELIGRSVRFLLGQGSIEKIRN